MPKHIRSLDSKTKSSGNSSLAYSTVNYHSDITFDSLARAVQGTMPNVNRRSYAGTLSKYETDLRVVVNWNNHDIMNGYHVLKNDRITFYGKSKGNYSYKSTM